MWTATADVTRRGEAIFLTNTWACALVAILLPQLNGLMPAAMAVLAFGTFRTALIPLANSMAFRALAGHPQGFAAIRLWGTVGYILAAVAAGIVLDRIGLRAAMHGIALATTACGLVGWMGRSRRQVSVTSVHLRDFLDALRDRRFLLLLAAASLAQVSFGPYRTFFTIHLGRLGLPGGFAGAAWALAAASELAVMLGWTRLRGLASPRAWMTMALGAHALRWSLSILARDPVTLLLIQLTHALTFGVFYLTAVERVDALAPDGLRATAQGVFSSLTFGVGGLVGNGLSGFLFKSLGMAWSYGAAATVATAATGLYWVGTRQAVAVGAILPVPGGQSR